MNHPLNNTPLSIVYVYPKRNVKLFNQLTPAIPLSWLLWWWLNDYNPLLALWITLLLWGVAWGIALLVYPYMIAPLEEADRIGQRSEPALPRSPISCRPWAYQISRSGIEGRTPPVRPFFACKS
jgi:hypothetical protein